MSPERLRFSDLLPLLQAKLDTTNGPASSSLGNLRSALSGFLEEQGLKETSPVGTVFRASYYARRNAHLTTLRLQGRSPAYIANRKSLLGHWRQCVLDFDRQFAIDKRRATPLQLALKELTDSGRSLKSIATGSGIPYATLKRWANGSEPKGSSIRYAPRIEVFCNLAPGALVDLLPQRNAVKSDVEVAKIDYRERLRHQSQSAFMLKEPSDILRREWNHFLQYKVTEVTSADDDDDGAPLRRSRAGRWSVAPANVSTARNLNWYCQYRGRSVAAANISWSFVAQFVGWLMLPESRGGRGMPSEEAQTLANFARRTLVRDFLEWRRERSGGFAHDGIFRVLTFASSLCNPRTGYLRQSYSRFATTSMVPTEQAWHERCDAAYATYKKLRESLSDDAAPSRDAFAPLRTVLAKENPLEAIADMVQRMRAEMCLTGGPTQAIDARDILMVMLLASNPIRVKNLASLSFRADGTGHLRKDERGAWRIFIPRQELKNRRGAARDADYEMGLRPEVWPVLEEYLSTYRPLLAGDFSDVVLLTREGKPFCPQVLGRRFFHLTKRYLVGSPGVGPHAMRHIVATAILKARPNDWHAAARALHDREDTVRQHYAHLAREDAEKWFDHAMAAPFSRM